MYVAFIQLKTNIFANSGQLAEITKAARNVAIDAVELLEAFHHWQVLADLYFKIIS